MFVFFFVSFWKHSLQIYKSEYLGAVKQDFVGSVVFFSSLSYDNNFFPFFFFPIVLLILCCYKWPGQVEPWLLHSWKSTKLSEQGRCQRVQGPADKGIKIEKQGIFSLYTDQPDTWVHTQPAVNMGEQPAKPQSNGRKFLRAKCNCLDLHQLKMFFSWP